jgi:hypothetical protein
MPGRPDSAIDFYGSPFCKEVLDAAHPLRFSKERITFGNDIFDGFRGQIWPANLNDEIADERRLAGARRLPLARLDDGSRRYGRLLDNVLRPFGRRECKDHYLATYPDDRPVAFTVLDFDRHPPKGCREPLSVESDRWLAIDEGFWRKVEAFHRLAAALDVGVLWVQSPGRWLVDGHGLPCRMFGLYAVVRHAPRTPSELRPMLEALKGHHGLAVEASWDTLHRNVRIPGQCFMNPCRVDPARRTIVPIRDPDARTERDRNMARLAATVEGYGMLRPDGGERLLEAGAERVAKGLMASPIGEGGRPGRVAIGAGDGGGGGRIAGLAGEDGCGGLVTSPIGYGEAPAAGLIGVGQGLVASPIPGAIAGKRGSGSARKAQAASDNTDPTRWLREPDTFRALHGSGLLRQALRLFGWDAARAAEAVSWMAPRFRRLRPTSSRTCSDPETLAAFLRKHYLWGCRTYDAAKAMGSARARARAKDEPRIMPSLRVNDKALEAYLTRAVGLSGKEITLFLRFRQLERLYAGRIACRTLYAAFGSQRRFMGFQARHGLLSIAQERSQSQGRCRQWTLSPRAVRSVRLLMASPVLLFMLRDEGGRVIYSETHQRNPRRKRRISAVHLAREARCALESVTGTVAARGPPPEPPKTRENKTLGMIDGASGARQRGERAVAA